MWKIKHGRFQYSLTLPPGTILFYYFTCIFILFTYFSDFYTPTLARDIFVKAGPRQSKTYRRILKPSSSIERGLRENKLK